MQGDMEALRQWLRQLSGFFILSVLIQNILPKKEYLPYIRLFLNLLMVLLLVQPLLKISADNLKNHWTEVAAAVGESYLEADLQKLNEKQTGLEKRQAQSIVRQEVETLLEDQGYGLERLEIVFDSAGECERLDIYVTDSYAPFRGLQQGEELMEEEGLKQYLEEKLDSACPIRIIR